MTLTPYRRLETSQELERDAIQYLDTTNTYVDYTDTKARVRNTGYPIQIDFVDAEAPADINTDQDYDLYKVVLEGGDNVKDLPRQYRQAMLLLVVNTTRSVKLSTSAVLQQKSALQLARHRKSILTWESSNSKTTAQGCLPRRHGHRPGHW